MNNSIQEMKYSITEKRQHKRSERRNLKLRVDLLAIFVSFCGCCSLFVVINAFSGGLGNVEKIGFTLASTPRKHIRLQTRRISPRSRTNTHLSFWNTDSQSRQQKQQVVEDEIEDVELEIKIPTLFNPIGTADAELSSNEFDAATQNVLQYLFAFLGLVLVGFVTTHPEFLTSAERLIGDPANFLAETVTQIQDMGPSGVAYFGFIYTIAEILAIPAIPLTASAGYLFGVRDGTLIVLLSASIAASISFFIGRTLLRSYVEGILGEYPKLQKLDRAISSQGFKIMLLVRVAPIFPFALSNYLYGVTSVKFWPYFWGTMLGFAPGTFAYVYSGVVGKILTSGDDAAQPWYVYAGGLALFSGFLKIGGDIASDIIDNIEDEENAS